MIIDDFPEIRKRMLGDLKAKPEIIKKYDCGRCHDTGWVVTMMTYIPCHECNSNGAKPMPYYDWGGC
jgi:hypothetical protein